MVLVFNKGNMTMKTIRYKKDKYVRVLFLNNGQTFFSTKIETGYKSKSYIIDRDSRFNKGVVLDKLHMKEMMDEVANDNYE